MEPRAAYLVARTDLPDWRFPVTKTGLAVVAVLAIVSPALSQDTTPESGCVGAFKRADLNSDGFLTHTEIPKAQELPPALAKASLVGRQEFIAACVKIQPAQTKQLKEPATVSPETPGQQQPQGKTGPLDTKSGGAPAESPQGQTPPGMQSAPEGSSKSIVDPNAK
jgi:hypothetical protein